jgi:predicted transcriptional regulator
MSTVTASVEPEVAGDRPECFVIMPISDPEGYTTGHFSRVFKDIFVPACDKAGYHAIRGDQVRATNMIHLDILQRLLSAPVALCDLSSLNPNVLFELGLRQAFDKPVVLVQETGTPRIFDIVPLRCLEYRRDRRYDEVLQDQISIAEAISETVEAFRKNEGVNSLVKLLELTRPASLSGIRAAEADPALQLIRAELSALRFEIRHSRSSKLPSSLANEDYSVIATPDERKLVGTEILRYLVAHRQPVQISEIGTALGFTRDLARRVLSALEVSGYIARTPTPQGNVYAITPEGIGYLDSRGDEPSV